jgi:meiotically up-regulated gene 157 (Mug157) protein
MDIRTKLKLSISGFAILVLGCAHLSNADTPPVSGLEFPSVVRAASDYHNADAHVEAIFRNGLLDASKQAFMAADGTAYVKTGDIPAEWLRDSSAQVRPYIYFAKGDELLTAFMRGMIARQFKYIQIDPYANAFNSNYTVWEEKFELDSLAYPIISAWTYWKQTGDTAIFTDDFEHGLETALATMQAEQDHETSARHYTHPDLHNHPVGNTGMIWTGFRPSDDPCTYNFLIPSEMMAVVALAEAREILADFYHNSAQAELALQMGKEVDQGIQKYGIVQHAKYGKIYAYEVDGLGHANLMDDANLPSLLSAPYFGYLPANDALYRNTRRFVLSPDNQYYYTGQYAHGEGSPHTQKGYIWPLALLAQGLTAQSPAETKGVLAEILNSDPGDDHLHESFNPNDPKDFSRINFGWPNSLFAEYMLNQEGMRLPVGSPHSIRVLTTSH